MEEEVDQWECLLLENPFVQRKIAEAKAEGRAKVAKARAEAEAKVVEAKAAKESTEMLQEIFVELIEIRFPPLAEFAQQKVAEVKEPVVLRLLLMLAACVHNEGTVRWMFRTLKA